MWSFKDLKSQAKVKLKKNYWLYLTICFLLAVFAFRYVTTNFAFNLDGSLKIFDVFSNLTAIESGEFKIALNWNFRFFVTIKWLYGQSFHFDL